MIEINRHYLKYLLCFLLVICVIFIGIYGYRRIKISHFLNDSESYSATLIDKMHRLDSVPSPRIILMSGSSFVFGLNSELLSNELELPVVNASLHSDLGSYFMMEQLKSTARKGDIVVISLEYETTSEGLHEYQLSTADSYPKAHNWIKYSSFFDKINAWFSHKVRFNQVWTGQKPKEFSFIDSTIFSRDYFTKNGDLKTYFSKDSPSVEIKKESKINKTSNLDTQLTDYQYFSTTQQFNNSTINSKLPDEIEFKTQLEDLNNFGIWAKNHGIFTYFIFPSYAQTSFENNMISIKELEKILRENLIISILGNPENGVMDDTLFMDKTYHLNAKGRKIFTSRLVQLLEQENI